MATANYSVTPRETRPKPSTPKPRLKLGISNWTSDDKSVLFTMLRWRLGGETSMESRLTGEDNLWGCV